MLGQIFDAIEFRGFKQETVEELAEYAGVPVFNGLTDEWHPTQMLCDLMTMKESCGKAGKTFLLPILAMPASIPAIHC